MKLALGLALVAAGGAWLARMAARRERPVSPPQALLDFATGAPLESVLAVGCVIFGVIVAVAGLL